MAVRVFQLSIVFTIVLLTSGAFPVSSLKNEIFENNRTLYLKDPQDVIVARGHSVSIKCDSRPSTVKVTHTWLLNGKPLNTSIIKSQVQKDGSLYIPKIGGKTAAMYQGNYSCTVSNPMGFTLLSNTAKLQLANIDREFKQQFTNQTVKESQPCILFCSINSVPKGIVLWEKDSLPLPHDSRYVPLSTGALLITKTVIADTGIYRCKVTNEVLKKSRISKGGLLTVEKMTEMERNFVPKRPEILSLNMPLNITTLAGNNLTLYCIVSAWPLPVIHWIFNDSVVVGNSSFLDLQNITLSSSGKYRCFAKNTAGNVSLTYTLEVNQPPYFNLTPTSMSFPVAKVIRLKCQALGHPPPTITWLKNGIPIEESPRIQISNHELKLSTSYTYDAGIYQCVASNSVGTIWSSAELSLFKSTTPPPPQNLRCDPYNESSICLRWDPPPNINVTAYSVHIYTVKGREYVTNLTYMLATKLNMSTNYTFFVRLYSSQSASDHSEYVSCTTGAVGDRNLKVQKVNENTVEVTWSKLTNDFPCEEDPRTIYKLEWRRFNQSSINSNYVYGFKDTLTGFVPLLTYQFRVNESNWIDYVIPANLSSFELNGTYYNGTGVTPLAPYQLDTAFVSSTSVNLTWNDSNHFDKYYSICYFESNSTCNMDELLETSSNNLKIDQLKSNTNYDFKVRTHNKLGAHGQWSPTLTVKTNADVPTKVRDVTFNVINRTSACIIWKPPLLENGKLTHYVVNYTPDLSWPLADWYSVNISASKRKLKVCCSDQEVISLLLNDLNPEDEYRVVIQAGSEVGLGNPASVLITTKYVDDDPEPDDSTNMKSQEDIHQKQKLGIALGIGLALICVISCTICLVMHKRRLKRQAAARVRYTTSNYYTGTCTPNTSLQMQNSCTGEAHEMEHLVDKGATSENLNTNSDTVEAKTGEKLTTTQLNGVLKNQNLNRHLTNGHVHITENPQYYNPDCNGHTDLQKVMPKLSLHGDEPLVEDTNSNLKNTHLDDLKKLYEVSRNKLKLKESPNFKRKTVPTVNRGNSKLKYHDISGYTDSSLDASLNSTQLSCLDDTELSVTPAQHLLSTPLGPNG